jgi:shikimate kinase / 3-dehydroquinate synthase
MFEDGAQSSTAIVLSGPPGVGKTTLGRTLAKANRRPALDLDAVLERRAGMPVGVLLGKGEPSFRAFEAEALGTLPRRKMVLSLGGGTLTTRSGRQGAHRLGPVLGLGAPMATLEARLARGGDRPLLRQTSLAELIEARRVSYLAIDRSVEVQGSIDDATRGVEGALGNLSIEWSRFADQSTRIVRGTELASATAGAVAAIGPSRPIVLLLDRGVPATIRGRYAEAIEQIGPVEVIELEGGEPVKTWSRLEACLERAVASGAGRQSVVVGIGGGAVCDLAGFLASVLGRGAPLVLVPTTLLSQIDAAIGGKVAVNLAGGRNLAGAFHPATSVLIDDAMLASLDGAELRSGMAELLKIAIIDDRAFFDAVVAAKRPTTELVGRAVRAKVAIVARDPNEAGERKLLNFGHTLGHALEIASGYQLRHGEAVAIGMAAATRLSQELGLIAADAAGEIINAIQSLGLPIAADAALLGKAADHIHSDKKGSLEAITLVTVRGVANATLTALSLTEATQALVRNGGAR